MKKSCIPGSFDVVTARWLGDDRDARIDDIRVERLSEGYVVRARLYSDYIKESGKDVGYFAATPLAVSEILARLQQYWPGSGE